MNPLSPYMRDLLKRLDTAAESKIPVSDIPRTTVDVPAPAAAEARVTPDPMENTPSPDPGLEASVTPPAPTESQPELLPVASEPEPEKKTVEPEPLPVLAPAPTQAHENGSPPPAAEAEEMPQGDDEGAPLPSDEDAPADHPADEFIDFNEIIDQSPVINDPEYDMLPRRAPAPPPMAAQGQRPFPPNLEPKRWYRMLLDEANRPIAIIDNSRDKSVYNYAVPPDKLTFKIDLSAVVQGASATFRAPLPVGEMADRLEGKKFCFECQPGAEGEEVVMKLVSIEPPLDGKEPKEEILRGKIFKSKGPPPLSSLPALVGHPPPSAGGIPPATPGKDLVSQMQWLENYQARQRSKRA